MALRDSFQDLGVVKHTIKVFSARAEGIDVIIYDESDPHHIAERLSLTDQGDGVWSGSSKRLVPGTHYALQAWGPDGVNDSFSAEALLIDPYAKGLSHHAGQWRSVVIDEDFDWNGQKKPNVPLSHTVIYEAHVRGLTKMHPDIPLELRGTYAGLAHPVMTEYLSDLGITAVELLPVHAFRSENHLLNQGLINYWGYNTVNFFTPHPDYATQAARQAGPSAIAREFKQMVKDLHAAGIEVILDVVYNHTAEEGKNGPRLSFRGLDNATYYRHDDEGNYVDTTGCGNSIDTSHPVVQRLILDSLRYWAVTMGVDGFRFDLAVTLGRDANHEYQREHPLLSAILHDPALNNLKIIAEPWDVGFDGWQTGNFPDGWSEWDDRYRDRIRNFWLSDIAESRATGQAPTGVGGFATRLAGSSNTFSEERGPLASVNFITAHDGFTLADLTAYNVKHNIGNGENNQDGTNENRSFNHGVEGPADDASIIATRRRTMRNLMGTLLLSAGVPMITAGDEFGRSQHGNNNAYCHDSPLTWVDWELQSWQHDLLETTKHLTMLRREFPAIRPRSFGRFDVSVSTASAMDWYNNQGESMTQEEWQDPANRTLQFIEASTSYSDVFSRILIVIHGIEEPATIVMPEHADVTFYEPLWFSTHSRPQDTPGVLRPGDSLKVNATSILVFNAVSK